ncbi:mitochondrial 37S ribosomal protein uS9m [Calcarisporiella thermophila]|uniref:mitochondrial 37S ribosomal protein uS9m n=1 Tax=Calcarisporiella thermophila TaxID=911321 RepID=UPI00374271BA
MALRWLTRSFTCLSPASRPTLTTFNSRPNLLPCRTMAMHTPLAGDLYVTAGAVSANTPANPSLHRLRSMPVAKPKPQKLDNIGRAYGLGRRKEAVARVWVVEGDGQVLVNGKPLAEYFDRLTDREEVLFPFSVTGELGRYNVWCLAEGGGSTGQSQAIKLGVTRALLVHNPALKPTLRKAGCVTRDFRTVERKKPGQAKARKKYTWVKR